MTDILDNAHVSQDEPKLIVRKAPHAPVWSVWAVLEGIPSEEIFEGSSEEEASSWINTGGQAWLEERRRKRSAQRYLAQLSKFARNTVMSCWNVLAKYAVGRVLASRC